MHSLWRTIAATAEAYSLQSIKTLYGNMQRQIVLVLAEGGNTSSAVFLNTSVILRQ